MATNRLDFLAHRDGDAVAVAVRNVDPGPRLAGYLDETDDVTLEVVTPVPWGHKVALCDVASGEDVVEYGVVIGRATSDIRTGDYVHVHNLKGERWS